VVHQVDVVHPFRFGVLAGSTKDVAAWREQAEHAEQLGYSSLLVPDHMGHQWGPLVALAVAAEHTSRIALGTLMLTAGLRQPAVLYKELATLALAAPGRLEIGLGAGWLISDFTRAGVAVESAGTRIQRLDEAASILRRLWAEGAATEEGAFYRTVDALGEPRGGAVRWTMGGGGSRMLRTAVRHADIVSISAQLSSGQKDSSFGRTATAEQFDKRVRWVREFAGPRMANIELQTLLFAAAIVPDRARYADRVLSPMFGLPAAQALASPLALVGDLDEICEQLYSRRERFGISYWVVPAAQLHPFAHIVARLSGK
jgi:probable F420-dependent oxidoreductase